MKSVSIAVLAVAMAAGLFCKVAVRAEEVRVWEVPAGAKPDDRTGWKSAEAGAAFKSGAALQNGKVVVLVAAGGPGAVVRSVRDGVPATATVGVVPAGAASTGKVERVELAKKERGEAVLRLGSGASQVDVKLKAGAPFVEVAPVKDAAGVEIRSRPAYALLPDLFGFDTVYDAKRFKSAGLMLPAENFLLSLEEGGDAMVMCVWQGALSLGKKREEAIKEADGREPRVDLFFSGEGATRRIERTRIGFAGKPVYVAVLAAKGTWLDLDVSGWKAQEPRELDWKRPFEAKWRATFVCREGASCKDLFSRTLSNDAWVKGENFKGDEYGGKAGGKPLTSLQGLWPHFVYPFWIDKDKTFVNLYADMAERKKGNPGNMFERAIVYPLDRRPDTPVSELTLVDVVRETLGEGPCEYALDLQGMQKRPGGGSRALLEPASCPIFDNHIICFVKAAKGQNTDYAVNGKKLVGIKPGEKFPPEMQERLIHALEDINLFLLAVNARIEEYRQFGEKLAALCDAEGKRSAQIKPLADKLMVDLKQLQTRTGREQPRLNKECADWVDRIKKIVEAAKGGNYSQIGVPNPRALGDGTADKQDILITFQRRVVKGIREEASSVDSTDPEVVRFAARVRALCQDALRNKHELEGW